MKLALASILLFAVQLSGQSADRVSFHVTSVQQGDATDGGANNHNLLQEGRPFIMRLQEVFQDLPHFPDHSRDHHAGTDRVPIRGRSR